MVVGAQNKETQKQKNLAREELRPGSGRLERAAYGGRTQGGGEGAPESRAGLGLEGCASCLCCAAASP